MSILFHFLPTKNQYSMTSCQYVFSLNHAKFLHISSTILEVTFMKEENGNPLQYFCLKNPTDRGAWWATVHAVSKSQT